MRGLEERGTSERRTLVEKVRNFLDEDRRVSIETTSTQFEVGVARVHRIIREDLNVHKVCDFVARG